MRPPGRVIPCEEHPAPYGMARPLPPLPDGFAWRRSPKGIGELTIWNIQVVARVELLGGQWRTSVNVCFHDSLHRYALAGSKHLACYWVHRWVITRAEAIYRARPKACILVTPRTIVG